MTPAAGTPLPAGPLAPGAPRPLGEWIAAQHRHAVPAMLRSVSPVGLQKARPGFGQVVRAVPGAIVASPVLADWNPDPDYFFHWYRDSAVVVDALRLLHADGALGDEAVGHVADFVRFSRALAGLDGATLAADRGWRARVIPQFVQYLRSDTELAALRGDAIAADTRVNADGTLDITRWNRPQHDGPPLRALALLRWIDQVPALEAEAAPLIRADLDFTAARWRAPSYDIWEEEAGAHYYTLAVSRAALEEGARWLRSRAEPAVAGELRAQADAIEPVLDGFWSEADGHYRSRTLAGGTASAKQLDIAVILAAIHAGRDGGPHSAEDPRLHATLARLESLFGGAFAINHALPPHRAPAMGRYAGDVYFSGGAWYVSTLGAAELCYRAAALVTQAPQRAGLLQHGDAFLETVRAHTPASGDLSEQFDPHTGAQTSARHLAWSYAAFISCVAARAEAIRGATA